MTRSFSSAVLIVFFSIIFLGCKDSTTNDPIVDESNISLVSIYQTNASTNGVCVYPVSFRNYAFIADGSNGLQIIDVTQVNSPDSVSSFNTGGSANDVTVAGINNDVYAFVSDYSGGLVIIDVSDPGNPMLTGVINIPGLTNTSFIDGLNERGYIGVDNGNLYTIDLSSLPNPPSAFTMINPSYESIKGLYVTGNLLYAACSNTGMLIYDVSNVNSINLLSVTNTSGSASDVVVNTGYAYIADSFNGLLIFNVSNPSAPSLLSRYPPFEQILGVAVNNNSAYTADNGYGVESINISNPSNPTQSGYNKTNSSANNVYYFGGYLYLAAAEGGLAIFRPSN